jgi:hypothetical protein
MKSTSLVHGSYPPVAAEPIRQCFDDIQTRERDDVDKLLRLVAQRLSGHQAWRSPFALGITAGTRIPGRPP